MGISVNSLSSNSNYVYRSILDPMPNRAEITMGMFRVPSANPLTPSSTASGTNANPALDGPYVSSAQILEARAAINSSNVVNTSNAIESGKGLQQALNVIAEQTPAPRFSTTDGIFTTKIGPATQESNSVNVQPFSPISTTSNIRTSSPIIDDRLSLTGRNAGISGENAANFASVNANFNVQYSPTGAQAIQSLNNAAAQALLYNASAHKMDGMIPMPPSLPNDFNSNSVTNASRLNVFNNVTEAFNNIMSGGGHAGTGGRLPNPQEKEASVEKKKGINFLG